MESSVKSPNFFQSKNCEYDIEKFNDLFNVVFIFNLFFVKKLSPKGNNLPDSPIVISSNHSNPFKINNTKTEPTLRERKQLEGKSLLDDIDKIESNSSLSIFSYKPNSSLNKFSIKKDKKDNDEDKENFKSKETIDSLKIEPPKSDDSSFSASSCDEILEIKVIPSNSAKNNTTKPATQPASINGFKKSQYITDNSRQKSTGANRSIIDYLYKKNSFQLSK